VKDGTQRHILGAVAFVFRYQFLGGQPRLALTQHLTKAADATVVDLHQQQRIEPFALLGGQRAKTRVKEGSQIAIDLLVETNGAIDLRHAVQMKPFRQLAVPQHLGPQL